MSNLISAAFENKNIRHQMIDGEPWFVAKDIAESLEISWNGATTLQAVDEEFKGLLKFNSPSGEQETYFLSEQGVYTLALRSNKPKAKEFTKWVANVIKQIRQTSSRCECCAEHSPVRSRPREPVSGDSIYLSRRHQ